MRIERRTNRSSQTSEALELLFAASAERGRFSSLVLAEEHGLVIAGAGDPTETEEIAALSACVAEDCDLWHGRVYTTEGEKQVTIAAVRWPDGRLLLAAVGGKRTAIVPELMHSSAGVCRILA